MPRLASFVFVAAILTAGSAAGDAQREEAIDRALHDARLQIEALGEQHGIDMARYDAELDCVTAAGQDRGQAVEIGAQPLSPDDFQAMPAQQVSLALADCGLSTDR